jgi:MFS transporter, PAT family, beta-lactamase induction signal transducer AmpG
MIKKILTRKMLAILFLGLASGVPLGVVLTLVQGWLTDVGINLKTIGLVSLVQFPYTFKFLWSPFMDRFALPFLGKRQGWMFVCQIGMFLSVAGLAMYNPTTEIFMVTFTAVLISFFGASHDIVVDAYRRDILDDSELGFGASLASNAYLIGYRFLATVLGLTMADKFGWATSFMILAALCLVGIVGTLIAPQPVREVAAPKTVRDAVVLPFLNYLSRSGAIEMLIFLFIYKLGDNFATNLQTTFYLKLGYTKTEIAYASKIVGFSGMFIGGMVGGVLLFKYSIKKCLLWFGSLQAISILGFALMNELITSAVINRLVLMGSVIGFETFCIGMSTAAYSAFMLKLCDRRFSATQFALLSSFMGIPRVFVPGWAGYVAEPFGWTNFFIFSFLLAIPGVLMVYFRADKWESDGTATV